MVQKESAIRAAMDRLLRGEIQPGGLYDVKTMATEAGVTRAALYSTYPREFERRRDHLRDAGTIPDPRDAQINRLREQSYPRRTATTAAATPSGSADRDRDRREIGAGLQVQHGLST